MRVVGIDPAPTKGLDTFDGGDRHVALHGSRAFIRSLCSDRDVLVCWDSPLTGPPDSTVAGGEGWGSAFSQRSIESFFSKGGTGFKTPLGISVRGYSGCPHWALSRALLGLPRVGPYDANDNKLPLRLLHTNTPPTTGLHVVEVHPAVAIWLWCRERRDPSASWEYKKSASVSDELWRLLMAVPDIADVLSTVSDQVPPSDDILDARVAFALGRLWLDHPGSVALLGGADHGTFLLPEVSKMREAFAIFVAGSA